jgi:hypothetical protein
MLTRNVKLGLLAGISLVALIVTGLFWNESRKEVKFLCQNFRPGNTMANVTRQLDTGVLLKYRTMTTESGEKIIFASSIYSAHVYGCTIEFDVDSKVKDAYYPSGKR